MPWIAERADQIDWPRLQRLVDQVVAEARRRICARPRRVLLLPPDITRAHSGAGRLTEMLYRHFAAEADVHVIPTLGQHVPHGPEENRRMFGSIPHERIHAHDWRNGCVRLGEIAASEVAAASQQAANWPLPIVLNRALIEEPWDLVINVGHVVPHEVLGFANHNKNYFIGLGGKDLICASHMMAASCGIENNLASLVTPVRACFNLAEQRFLSKLPDLYVQVVLARNQGGTLAHTGFYAGDDLETYLAAARQSRQENITVFDRPVEKIVCVMQADEFVSTWVANKAIYRTRMAIADGGELLILAPGLKRFGEQADVDALIRKYGYRGTPHTLSHYAVEADMQDLAHAAAHLIHGSSEGRFRIVYAPGHLTRNEIEGVGFEYADLAQAIDRYRPDERSEGWQQTRDGEKFFFIPTPAAGLWATREKIQDRSPGGEDERRTPDRGLSTGRK